MHKSSKPAVSLLDSKHVGILGNEKADAAAKSALSLPVSRMKLPATGMYPRITKLIFDEWQEVFNSAARETNCMLTRNKSGYKKLGDFYISPIYPEAPLNQFCIKFNSGAFSRT